MKTRSDRRKPKEDPEVVELLSSDDEELEVKKPPARKRRPAKRKAVSLLSDEEDDDDYSSIEILSPRKRIRYVSSESDKASGIRRTTRSQRKPRSSATSRAAAEKIPAAAAATKKDSSPSLPRNSRKRRAHQNEYDADLEFARKLQQEEDQKASKTASSNTRRGQKAGKGHDADAELARMLQEQLNTETRKAEEEREKKDAAMAATLHTEETKERDERKQKELDSMKDSHAGKSVLMVDQVLKLSELCTTDGIEAVGKDDAVYLAEKMLALQDVFKNAGIPFHVCICYHYTHGTNMDSIRTDGLLTYEDRMASASSKNAKNVAFFGPGIYTANNPLGFTNFGDVGLMMAVLKGKEQHVGSRGNPKLEAGTNAVIGNKLRKGSADHPYCDEIILKQSAQVLPLVRFQQAKITQRPFAEKLWSIHQQIQHQVLDPFFNESVPTPVARIDVSTHRSVVPVPNPFPKASATAKKPPPAAVASTTAAAVPTPTSASRHQSKRTKLAAPIILPSPLPRRTGRSSRKRSPPFAASAAASMVPPVTATLGFGFGAPPAAAALSTSAAMGVGFGAPLAAAATGFALYGAGAPPAAALSTSAAIGFGSGFGFGGPPTTTTAPAFGGVTAGLNLSGSTIHYTAPNTLAGSKKLALQQVAAGDGDCSICICPLADGISKVVKLPRCNHQFHENCIEASLKHDVKCPDCRTPITQKLAGKGPSGTMTIATSPGDVSGFPRQGSIFITYSLQGGVQKAYHQNPGVPYSGTVRTAYLPNNQQGQDLLKRLKYAFAHGLSFSIGTSLTNHTPNVIVWGSVHHKTGISGGVHAWPDPNYFGNANSELDGLGVPPAASI